AATGQPTANSRALRAARLRQLRDGGSVTNVALIGHRLGGVLAVDALIENPDLVPFVNTVVPIDSPFGGINSWWWLLLGADCDSASELIDRRLHYTDWQNWYDRYLPGLQNNGLY